MRDDLLVPWQQDPDGHGHGFGGGGRRQAPATCADAPPLSTGETWIPGGTSDHEKQQPAPRRGKVPEALARAEQKVFTRPAPKFAKAQVKFPLTRAKGSTKAVAERLGASRRTVERYRAGTLTTPQKRLRAALVEETESEWQSQVRA
ncbi:hypothetical protein ACFYXM_31010 [Streptomyces sp. NPDC002476]|uniref:hypothetical protein n=1 Tax=Streptomyces sp. NPDC002476 TaxID=3364648 RepID=UPI0036C486DF